MPTPQFSLPGGESPEALKDYIIKLQRDLQYLLTNLDDLNVSRLHARVIIAETITTEKLAAGSITTEKLDAEAVTTEKLKAGAVTAEKITVDELSAISANLGHITAGLIEAIEIFGSYIATANGTFPRVELSSDANLLAAYSAEGKYVALSPSQSGAPAYVIFDGAMRFRMQYLAGAIALLATEEMQINTSFGDLILSAAGSVAVPSWLKFKNSSSGKTLQQELNDIWNAIDALEGP